MVNGTLLLKVKLLTGENDWSRVKEKHQGQGRDKNSWNQEVGVDLAYVDEGHRNHEGSFDGLAETEYQIVVDDSQVSGELVDKDARRVDIKEPAGAADNRLDHILVR